MYYLLFTINYLFLISHFYWFISYHFISFHFISFHFISFHFISFHFLFCLFVCQFISPFILARIPTARNYWNFLFYRSFLQPFSSVLIVIYFTSLLLKLFSFWRVNFGLHFLFFPVFPCNFLSLKFGEMLGWPKCSIWRFYGPS